MSEREWLYKGEGVSISFELVEMSDFSTLIRKERHDGIKKVMIYDKVIKPLNTKTSLERAEQQMGTMMGNYRTKKGYYDTRQEALKGIDEIDSCLLLVNYDDVKSKIKYPQILMPKIDGLRGRCTRGNLITRGGKEFTGFSHITCMLLPEAEYDGELYQKGKSLQEIMSICRSSGKLEEKKSITYYIFDKPDKKIPYKERLLQLSKVKWDKDCIVVVPYYIIYSELEGDKLYKSFLEDGYEGAVYRNPEAGYKCKRSSSAIKRKPLNECEVLIMALDRDTDGLIMFITDDLIGGVMRVTPSWSDAVRKEDHYDKDIGSYLTIQYREKTDAGKPRHAVGKVIRETDKGGRVII